LKFLFSIIIVVMLSSCATAYTQKKLNEDGYVKPPFQEQENIGSRFYSGTNYDLKFLFQPPGYGGNFGWPFILVDLGLSLAADTMILPYTIYVELTEDGHDSGNDNDSIEP